MSNIFDLFKQVSSDDKKKAGPVEFIIAGLGNPGLEYENTRHNTGFMAIDTLAKRYNVKIDRMKFKSLCTDTEIAGKRCLLMKPTTYMNNSGEAIVEAMNFYKVPVENIIVMYDDISLAPSKLRIRRKGSDGGHNGIKSIIYLTGSDEFPRIKIGVGKKPHPDYNLADWVLSAFKGDDVEKMQTAFDNACNCIELMINEKTEQAMNLYNA